MLASPSCPGLVPGRPYLQIDYARASWACDRMSSSALRCWLRLLTYFRNDRPIPAQSSRSLARIAGVSQASARKALAELLPLVAFSMPDAEDELEGQGPDPTEQKPLTPDQIKEGGEQKSLTCEQDSGGGEQKRLSHEGFETSGEQKALSENPLCNWIALESPTGEQKTLTSQRALGPAEQKVLTPRAEKTQKRAESTQQRAENAHPSISSKEVEKKGITPPPTSSSAAQAGSTASRSEEEEGPFLDNLSWREPNSHASSQTNSQQPLTGGNSPVTACPGGAAGAGGPAPAPVVVPDPNFDPHFDPHRIPVDRRLFEVGAELIHFWCGKPGPRTAMAFAVLQSELIQIVESPLGGIEAVREQLVTGVQKGWAMVKFRTWLSWRQSQPQPVLVTDEELDEGSLWPGLPSFIRRYRATYGKSCSDTEVTCAYISHREKLLKQANPTGQDLGPNAWMHSAHVPNPTLPSASELASYAAEWQQSQASFRSALVQQGGGA